MVQVPAGWLVLDQEREGVLQRVGGGLVSRDVRRVWPRSNVRGVMQRGHGHVHESRKNEFKRWIQGVWGSKIGENGKECVAKQS